MEKLINVLKVIVAVTGGYVTTMVGGFDNLINLLLFLACCDLAFGGAKGIKNKNFSSSIFFWGLINKAVIFVVIAMMVKVDLAIGKVGVLRNAFIIWFALCEAASIVENSAALGAPWPDGLLSVLVQVRKGFSINLSKIVKRIIADYAIPEPEADTKESEKIE